MPQKPERTERDIAWAEALEAWAATALTLATRLRQATEDESPDEPQTRLGARQRAVLDLPELLTAGGLSAADVGARLTMASPNAHKLLSGLERRGLLRRIDDARPARWTRM